MSRRPGPSAETLYVISEIQHLTSCGLDPERIVAALGRTATSLCMLLRRNGEYELVNLFEPLREGRKKTNG